jgi:outer membrane protein assembly factor BamB
VGIALYWTVVVVLRSLDLPTVFRFFPLLVAALLLALCFLTWCVFGRQTPFRERLLTFAAVAGGAGVLSWWGDPSTRGMVSLMFALPVVLTVWVAWGVVARKAPSRLRRVGLVAVVALAWSYFLLIRMDGLNGEQDARVSWRWTPTAEELFLAERGTVGSGPAPGELPAPVLQPGDSPGFRGPGRDGVVDGESIASDWSANPPRQVWRRRVGPAWSSVAVAGGRLYTQEQRGSREAVVCYEAETGAEVWSHEDAARFYEAVSGAGPRATPAFADGRVFALGAAGVLNCLDARTGERRWSRDVAADASAKAPLWGFASSPLVMEGGVVVYAGGDAGKGLLAYRAYSGEPAWTADAGQLSYSSPQAATVCGTPQVLMWSDRGLLAVDPATGAVLWEHAVPAPGAPRSLQPHAVAGGKEVLVASEADLGVACVAVTHEGGAWAASRRWSSRQMKPSFNDFVVHEGHAYGFDGYTFCCINLESGARCWKEGRYGHGQVVLLADRGLLLVGAENGEVALLAADPHRRRELGRFRAVEGKVWASPVVAHGRLYVRSDEEMACYDLRQAGGP